jgi:hypothetical protein
VKKMVSDEEIERIASRVAEKLKEKMGTAAMNVSEGGGGCDVKGDVYTCDASSFTCPANQFGCAPSFSCPNEFTGVTMGSSVKKTADIAASVAVGFKCPSRFDCKNKYNCVAPHLCSSSAYTHKLETTSDR